MEIFKKLVVFALASVAAVVLILWSLDAFGFRSPTFAFLLNWLAMSWVAIAGQAVHFSLPQGYYSINTFERTGQLYEHLGVRLFKRLVRRGPLAMLSPTLRFPEARTTAALRYLEDEIRKAETGHLYIFVLMLLFISAALLRRQACCTCLERWQAGSVSSRTPERNWLNRATSKSTKIIHRIGTTCVIRIDAGGTPSGSM